jgi:hypothetical protein
MNLFSANIEIEGHILRVNNEINTLQRNHDLLIDSVINAQKGVLRHQVISPVTFTETLIEFLLSQKIPLHLSL